MTNKTGLLPRGILGMSSLYHRIRGYGNRKVALFSPISRAGVVNRQDLADALKAGRLAGAAMDLCDPLPVSMTDPMLDAPRTVLTPHMAWQTHETFRCTAAMSVENILNYFRGEPSHVANPDVLKVSRPRLQPSRKPLPADRKISQNRSDHGAMRIIDF